MPPQRQVRGLLQSSPAKDVCLELTDHSITRKPAVEFFQLQRLDSRIAASQAARQAEQFITANRRLCAVLDVTIDRDYDGSDVSLIIRSGSAVGAIPLISPTTARKDLGLVVQPRFPWRGIGPMLAEMGWMIAPSPLRMPLLHRSERKVPLWVLSSMILIRMAALLDALTSRFEMVHEHRVSPRGTIHWDEYVRREIPVGKLLSIPCSFPDLQEDRFLRGSIRYTLERQIQSLQTQVEHGSFVHRLIKFAENLLRRVQRVPIYIPTPLNLQSWMQRPMRSDGFLDGVQAIEWTVDERGLAGISDLQGLPWRMPMDRFFEAWVETIFALVARKTGAGIKTGRQRQTTHAIDWQPAYLGSQKSLVPDIWLEWGSTTLIVDAKYKRHWEELNQYSWSRVEDELRENHRTDLFQVLAYANLAQTNSVIACLAYPCAPATWLALERSGRLIHTATVSVGTRAVHLWLTAIPMLADKEAIAAHFCTVVRSVLAA
jgi:hypothetical protein